MRDHGETSLPRALLTEIVARNTKAIPGKRFTIWDTKLPSFGLRVSTRTKTWTVMVDRDRRRRITVGRYPTMGLQAARTEARRLINAVAITRSTPGTTPITFGVALEKFIKLHLSQNRRSMAKERERVLRKHCEPRWRSRLLSEIRRSHVTDILDAMHDTPIMANSTFAIIRLFFRWSVRRGYLLNSPCEAMQAPAKRHSRERVLNREELAKVLQIARSAGTFGKIVTLLAFTAQRRGEIAALHSSWINRASLLLTIPPEVAKNGREHQVPLTSFTVGLLPDVNGLLFSGPRRARNSL